MRRWTNIAVGLCVFLLVWYLAADRLTPYTSNARVHAFVVPIVPQVSGYVQEIAVENNGLVAAGDLLLRIDQRPYRLAVESAQASLDLTGQDIGASTAAVDAAQARLAEARSRLSNMEVQTARVFELEKKGLATAALADDARAKLVQANSQVQTAEAELERAKQQMGSEGSENPKFRAALAELAKARLDLEWTEIRAPADGLIANLAIDEGAYARAGQPLMTLITIEDVWIEAYFTENNLGRIKAGDPVDIAFDIAPGRIFAGEIVSLAPGAVAGRQGELGGLARVEQSTGWLRDPQRFPVTIRLVDYRHEDGIGLRVNSQADVTVYTGRNFILNALAYLRIRLASLLSYGY
ncbi:MAG: HlyD family secretion protein [Rhodospirillales bacterium]|nr:MAG: HlyD family secretion protein [Rhodospirillales bacterium]